MDANPENPYRAPAAELLSTEDRAAGPLYRMSAVGIATFFGTPLAGAYIMAHNLRALGQQDRVRNAWQLGMNPIGDLTDTLEAVGLLVIVVGEDNPKFSGLTAKARTDGGREYPVVAVSKLWPGDRQRFTLAHELGHLMLEGRLADGLDEEKACNRFAGAFLAPRVAVIHLLGQQRHALEWQELYVLKHEFGLSMAGWLQRAKQCGVITDAFHLSMVKRFSAKGWRKNEPGDPLPKEHPRLFDQLVYRALAEQYICEGKAAELLGIPMMRFHKERQLESSDAVAYQ